jgi:presenilin-like A22 family membrane protease
MRYFAYLLLAVAAVFLVVASQAFVVFDIANVSLGVGIGMLAISLLIAFRYRRHVPSLVIGLAAAVVSAWMIVSSQLFSLSVVQNLTFAEALGVAGLTIIGLTAHELSTERVVHSLQPTRERKSASHTEQPRQAILG